MEDITAEMSEQIMQAWGAWMGKVGDALVDGGAPFAGRTAVAGDGSVTSASDLNGYTIVDAPDIDTAKTLCDGNPFVSDGTAKFAIEIYELVPM
jgi:hypothetical protein